MRPEKYAPNALVEVFTQEKVLALDAIGRWLGNPSKRTIMRKLKALECRASYSHAGRYYTRDRCADFSSYGLWSFKDIHFSQHGTLIDTILYLVRHSTEGFLASELRSLLHVRVHNVLADLHSRRRLVREQIRSEYLYLWPAGQSEQLERRRQSIEDLLAKTGDVVLAAESLDTIQQNMLYLASLLNEKQRRLYLGLESMKSGYGGDRRISQMTGVNVKTIARGRRELEAKDVTLDRIRRVGAGRRSVKKTPP